MFSLFRTRLVVKLGLSMGLAVLVGFSILAAGSARIESRAIEDMHRNSARGIATSLAAGVRNSMLTGNGSSVRALLDDAKTGLGSAEVRVFAPSGEEVFGKKPPAPPPNAQPAHVRSVLSTKTPAPAGDANATPLQNEKRCRKCHEKGDLRGVLTLGTKGARVPIDGSEPSLDALSTVARAGFVQIMTAKHEDQLDEYFGELAKLTPGIRGVAVYTTVAERKFGDDVGIADDVVLRGTKKGVQPFTEEKGEVKYHVIPLANEKRCQGCHNPKEEMNGAMVVAFAPKDLDAGKTLAAATTTSLDHVMLSGLGRMIVGFMDEVARAGVVTTLTVHDDEGRLYHDAFAKYAPPPSVRTVLDTHKHFETVDSLETPEYLFVEPLPNDPKCQRCHGPDLPVRGAIQIALDTSKEIAALKTLRERTIEFAALTIIAAIVLLWLVLRTTVLSPVQKIGSVAERVGAGDFDARLSVHSSDEMGRLATRINDMVAGLRHKMALSKYVSHETLKSVESLTSTATLRNGERRRVTMLFSDVRGFTAFSETRQPEEVVAMLNDYLQVQADVVSKHGGDIDKFVGDELMARFTGEDAEKRAARCAVEMIKAVSAMETKQSHGLSVGVGVNAGDVVLGSMGAEHRLDFTVIGDAVNLAARLCSAAKGNEVLVTKPIRDAIEGEGLKIEELEPIKVKGKAEPIPIYRVT
jgi:class 3 adenylate cyclase